MILSVHAFRPRVAEPTREPENLAKGNFFLTTPPAGCVFPTFFFLFRLAHLPRSQQPRGDLYAEEELTLECDYEYEKKSQLRMAAYLRGDPHWNVPDVIEELCSKGVLTTTFAPGVAIDKAISLPQEVGAAALRMSSISPPSLFFFHLLSRFHDISSLLPYLINPSRKLESASGLTKRSQPVLMDTFAE